MRVLTMCKVVSVVMAMVLWAGSSLGRERAWDEDPERWIKEMEHIMDGLTKELKPQSVLDNRTAEQIEQDAEARVMAIQREQMKDGCRNGPRPLDWRAAEEAESLCRKILE
jgi:hypothetical protein